MMKYRFTVSFIALTSVTLCCHAASTSIRIQLGRRRYLESKSSKSSQNLFDEETITLSAKSAKGNDSTEEAISSKSSKTQFDDSRANLSSETMISNGHIEAVPVEKTETVYSKSTKTSKTVSKKTGGTSVGSNLFEHMHSGKGKSSKSSLFELGDELNQPIISDDHKETSLTDLSISMSTRVTVENTAIVYSKSAKSTTTESKSSKALKADETSSKTNDYNHVQIGKGKSFKPGHFEMGDKVNQSIIYDEHKDTSLTDLSMSMGTGTTTSTSTITSTPDSAPTNNPSSPAAPFTASIVDTVISQVLTNNNNEENNNEENKEMLFIDKFDGSRKQDFTEVSGYSTIRGNNNASLVIGLTSVSVVLILATVGLAASRRKSLMREKFEAGAVSGRNISTC
eukprot:scaffold14569_cov49-Cyclotella_meneghiniana.AAC.4